MQTDPIADYLTRIRNAIRAGHDEVEIPASGLKMEMSRILKEQGYINDFHKKPATVGEAISVRLKYTEDRQPVILGIERVSRPGRRRYVDHKNVPRVRAKGVGGEVVAYVW
jgi:small subunit ribosomal protein S8